MQFTIEDLCELVGVPESEVTFLAAGINHQAFILRFEHDGESLYPRLDARIAGDPELQRRVRVALYRRLGFFPTESSEHAAEYVPWFMGHDDEIERYRIPVDEYIRRSEANLDEYERVKDALARGEPIDGRALERVRVHDHQLDRHRRAVGDLRQRAERRADRRACRTAPASRFRASSTAPASGRRRCPTTRRSSPP